MGDTTAHLGNPLRDEFGKFSEALTNITKIPDKSLPPIIVKMADAVDPAKAENWFKTLTACIAVKRRIEITYKALYTGETEDRRVDPYGLVYYEGSWILVGYCHLREEIRHFVLDRILSLVEEIKR